MSVAGSFSGKTYWIVGASYGLGRALAEGLAEQGAKLVLSGRDATSLQELAGKLVGARALALDVTDMASLDEAQKQLPQIDGIIYSAGDYLPMSAQDWDTARALQILDVNLLGAVRILGMVLPQMIERDNGHIVLIGSLAGYQGLPGAIGYGASKAGLMHLGENLYCDLQQTKIKVQVINPGFIQTRLTQQNSFLMPQILSPKDAADRTLKLMQTRKFMSAYPAPFKWVFILGKFLPYKLFARLIRAKE